MYKCKCDGVVSLDVELDFCSVSPLFLSISSRMCSPKASVGAFVAHKTHSRDDQCYSALSIMMMTTTNLSLCMYMQHLAPYPYTFSLFTSLNQVHLLNILSSLRLSVCFILDCDTNCLSVEIKHSFL